MSADATAAIGPVSVRYAAQIRELLYAQALQRMAADREAARDLLQQAGCPRATAATMRALASAGGARRHVDHRITRSRK